MDDNTQIKITINTILQSISTHDDTKYIQDRIKDRLALGRKRYGHGIIVDSDVSQYSESKKDSWFDMADEEFYDGLVYLAAARIRRKKKNEDVQKIDTAMKFLIEGIKSLHS